MVGGKTLAGYDGHQIYAHPAVEEGAVYASAEPGALRRGKTIHRMTMTFHVGPLTYWSLTHNGRYPFETRYCAGARELRRERRRATP
jgi:hypothetical protein